MQLLNRKTRVALKTARTGLKAYGTTQRARGRMAARGAEVGIRRGAAMGVALGGAAGYALARMAKPRSSAKERPNDATLTRKVETQIFRDPDAPKGRVSVNTENGVVYLRGEVEPDQITALGKAAAKVDGVTAVENLLHPPGTPAPMKH